MGKNSANENVNVVAENAVVTLLDNLFKDIAYIDVTTVRRNIGYASEGGMTKEDRMIRVETANYFMKHFAVVYLGLVINAELRDEFIKAIQLEMGIDNISEADRKKYRAQMKPDEEDMSKGNYLIDLSSYNDAVYTKINKKILLSMMMGSMHFHRNLRRMT